MSQADQIYPEGRASAQGDAIGEAIAYATMRLILPAIVIVSMGNFNEGLVSPDQSSLQQIAAVALWALLIGVSFLVRPRRQLEFNTDAAGILAFYGFAVLSVLWTDLSAASVLKAASLSLTCFGALRLVTRMDLDDIVSATVLGMFALMAASMLYVFLVPEFGINHSWMQNGLWQGLFESKQTLGTIGAFLMFFAYYRKVAGAGWLSFLAVFLVAAACVIGSGSRGGGALAIGACVTLYLSMRSNAMMRIFAVGPLVMTVLAAVIIFYFYRTGYDAIYLFDEPINLTERTYIWQHAISHFQDAPFLGFGLNGFWTVPAIYDQFLQAHGWVLDNFHSGYVTILIETGLVGYLLFAVSVFFVMAKILYLTSVQTIAKTHCALIVGFAFLSFQINFTETTFLRSTTFTSVLLVAFMLAVCKPVKP